MKILKKNMDLKNSIRKEWIITNGIGGFASSTIFGTNTRRYHGLLVAPSGDTHGNRNLILSKIDESIYIDDTSYNLFTNICSNYISDGYKNLECFEKNPLPEFTYRVERIKVTKKISMIYGHNTTLVNYTVKNDNDCDVKMTLAPILNHRNFHYLSQNHEFVAEQKIGNNKIEVSIDGTAPIYIYFSAGEYIEHFNDKFKKMYYFKEEERGFDSEEDLYVPGIIEINIPKGKKVNFSIITSLESDIENIDVDLEIKKEEERLSDLVSTSQLLNTKKKLSAKEKSNNKFLEDLIIASDNFVIKRKDCDLHSIIAGYPWFLDWGRDTAISFEGLLLITKRYDIAKDVLKLLVSNINSGLVPNGYDEFTLNPLYNSSDSSLLFIEQVNKYLKYTKDYDFVKEELFDKMKDIISNYQNGINLDNNNIYIDSDHLLVSGTSETQNTWMDAKIGNYSVTPRNGKVVELNSLWYNALKTMEFLSKKFELKDLTEYYKKEAEKHRKSFEKEFYNEEKKCLYDVIGDGKLRPNQLFSISTTFPVIKPSSEIGKKLFETVRKKLLTNYGVRTLAQDEEDYCKEYFGDPKKRDMAYHQGTAWVWLLGVYFDAIRNIIDDERDRIEKEKFIIEKEKFERNVYKTFFKEFYDEECICNISELYNGEKPFKPGGTFAQAWSISEIIKIVTNMEEV